MSNSLWLPLLLQLILIACNAVFAAAEIAVISMNDNRIAKLATQGDRRALRLARLTSQPARFLATIQVAITLSGFLGSAFAADNFSDRLVYALVQLGVTISEKTLDTIAVIVITLILSYFTLVLGELVPKRVAMRNAEKLALGMSSLIYGISRIFAPLVSLLTVSTNGILRLLHIDPNDNEDDVSEEDIRMMVDVGSERGTIDKEEKEFIQNVFEFDDLTAGEIATHRTEVSILWLEETMEQWEVTIHDSRHTRYPVCDESVDNVIGILNSKDYFRLQSKDRETVMAKAVKPVYFIPESVKADVLFRNMKATRFFFAVVLDEYGGVVGIVTMSDLLEELVGDVNDRESGGTKKPEIERIDSKRWKIRGTAELDEVEEALKIKMPTEDYDTFNGLVFGIYGSVPEDGTKFKISTDNLLIEVLNVQRHQVHTAIVQPRHTSEPQINEEKETKA